MYTREDYDMRLISDPKNKWIWSGIATNADTDHPTAPRERATEPRHSHNSKNTTKKRQQALSIFTRLFQNQKWSQNKDWTQIPHIQWELQQKHWTNNTITTAQKETRPHITHRTNDCFDHRLLFWRQMRLDFAGKGRWTFLFAKINKRICGPCWW